ncbi:MAG: hypothetical protein ACI9DH_000976, partial [Halioglobus sp.]
YDQQLASGVTPRLRVEDYSDLEIDTSAWSDNKL